MALSFCRISYQAFKFILLLELQSAHIQQINLIHLLCVCPIYCPSDYIMPCESCIHRCIQLSMSSRQQVGTIRRSQVHDGKTWLECGPALMVVWSKASQLPAALSPLPGFQCRPGGMRKTCQWNCARRWFPPGFPHQLQLASHDLAAVWQKRWQKNKIPNSELAPKREDLGSTVT